jgi:hypothetical protein
VHAIAVVAHPSRLFPTQEHLDQAALNTAHVFFGHMQLKITGCMFTADCHRLHKFFLAQSSHPVPHSVDWHNYGDTVYATVLYVALRSIQTTKSDLMYPTR